MNPANYLLQIPAKYRQTVYVILGLAAAALAAYKAADGDWLEFAWLLLGFLGFGTATVNTAPHAYEGSHRQE